ncbi:MAG: hypothetical protein Unbinned221contig1000_31 [Prokaryotic dsDNA virus sp.]|nr:MAG: hypothetical protein Unbinned221contig1000_31 [Prokaryotic dsDNA virus sp.]|tara:strand:+ start:2574 stop:3185 length:612 start_codon:yes stop_codon:yes gene_type:complete
MKGHLKLHRALRSWEWYKDANTMRVFIHCLLKCNESQYTYEGNKHKRGSFISGRNVLADELAITPQQVRTCLNKLVKTGEISIDASRYRHSVITINNYDTYQMTEETTKKESKPVKKSIEQREYEFMDDMTEFVGTYSKQMLRQFFDYWTERGKNDRLMRFEKQKSFDIKKRLVTWSSKEWNKTEITRADDELKAHIQKELKK